MKWQLLLLVKKEDRQENVQLLNKVSRLLGEGKTGSTLACMAPGVSRISLVWKESTWSFPTLPSAVCGQEKEKGRWTVAQQEAEPENF